MRHIFQQAHSKHQLECGRLVLRRMGIGIGIGMETPDLRAGWPRGGFDATQNRIVGLASAPPRGRAEACVIVTSYFREKFF